MSKMNRRALLARGGMTAATLAVGATGVTRAVVVPGVNSSGSVRESLIGAWHLVSLVETDVKTGEAYRPLGNKPQGLILYTHDGYMSAQLSAAGRPNFASGNMYKGEPQEFVAAGLSYLSYSGPYYV